MHPFRRPESDALADQVADLALDALDERGLAGASIGTVATAMGTSRQSLTYRLGRLAPGQDPVSILQRVVVERFSDRWWRWSTCPAVFWKAGEVPGLAIPETAEELQGVRAWHALRELARVAWAAGDEGPMRSVTAVREQEHVAVGNAVERWTRRQSDPAVVAAIVASTDGLRIAVADLVAPMSADRATALLAQHVISLAGPSADAVA